jgi:hypothetical protein
MGYLDQDRLAQMEEGVLDVYHASDHLWARADHLFGEGSPQPRQWTL